MSRPSPIKKMRIVVTKRHEGGAQEIFDIREGDFTERRFFSHISMMWNEKWCDKITLERIQEEG